MNTLNQFGKQISDLFASMTPSARIMAGLMVGVIVVSLGWILSSDSVPSHETLLGGSFTPEQLDRMETAFSEAQLRGHERVGRQLRIPTAEKDQYLRALSDSGALPATWGSEIDKALSSSGVFESPDMFAARTETAKEREMALIIKGMSGVEEAYVEYDEKRTAFLRKTDRVCSVAVRAPFGQQLDQATLRAISKTVSTMFAGLPEDRITVIDLRSKNFYQASSDPSGADDNPYLANQVKWEEKYYQQIRTILGSDYGAVQLSVSVELDPTLMEESEKLTYDPTAVAVQSSTSRKDTDLQKAGQGGRPGAAPNGVTSSNQPATLANGGIDQASTSKETEENERKVAGHEATIKRTAGLVPNRVRVALGIPESHYSKIWNHRQSLIPVKEGEERVTRPPTDAEMIALKAEVEASLRSAVQGIPVGIRTGEEAKPFIEVYAYTDLPLPEFPAATVAENTVAWLGHSWSTLALIGVLLVSLGMMFSWVRSQGTPEADKSFADGFGLTVPDDMGDQLDLGSGEEGAEGAASSKRPKVAFDVTGADMKDDLSTLINDNPEAAVNLIKAWIGEAA